MSITEAGLAALGTWEPLPRGEELLAQWQTSGKLGKAERAIADVLMAVYPDTITRQEVADRCGYTVTSGGFRNALGKLRTLAIMQQGDPLRLASEFMS